MDRGTEGFDHEKPEGKHGIRLSNTAVLTLDDVFVAPQHPGLGVIHRDASGASTGADVVVAFNQFGTLGRAEDLHWTLAPEPATELLAAVSLLVVALLSRRFSSRPRS